MRVAAHLRHPALMRVVTVALFSVVAMSLFALTADPAAAAAPGSAQESPYQAPDLIEVDLPGWAEPFEPLARLPLWAQAALVSAAVAGLVFVVPVVYGSVTNLDEVVDEAVDHGRRP